MATETTIEDSEVNTIGADARGPRETRVTVHDDGSVVLEQEDAIISLTDEQRDVLLGNIESALDSDEAADYATTVDNILLDATTYDDEPMDAFVVDHGSIETVLVEGEAAVETLYDTLVA